MQGGKNKGRQEERQEGRQRGGQEGRQKEKKLERQEERQEGSQEGWEETGQENIATNSTGKAASLSSQQAFDDETTVGLKKDMRDTGEEEEGCKKEEKNESFDGDKRKIKDVTGREEVAEGREVEGCSRTNNAWMLAEK